MGFLKEILLVTFFFKEMVDSNIWCHYTEIRGFNELQIEGSEI
jgi:hypothetical protein